MEKIPEKLPVALFSALLLIRIIPALALFFWTGDAVFSTFESDSVLYLYGARGMIASGVNEFAFFAPLNSLFIAGLLVVGAGSALAPVLATACLGWLSVLALYCLGRELMDERTARLAALVYGVYPNLVFYGVNLYSETLAIFLITVSFLLLVRYLRTGWVLRVVLSGVLWGLASQTRGGLHFFTPFLCAAIVWNRCGSGDRAARGLIAGLAPAAVLACAVYLTMGCIGYVAAPFHGSAALNTKSGIGSALHGANRLINCNTDYGMVRGSILYRVNESGEAWPEGVQVYSDELLQQDTVTIASAFARFIARDPVLYVRHALERISFLWAPNQLVIKYIKYHFHYRWPVVAATACLLVSLFYVVVISGALLGLAGDDDDFKIIFVLFIVFYCTMIFFTVGNAKLRLPMMPFCILYCARFLVHASRQPVRWRRHLPTKTILVLLLFFGNSVYRYTHIMLSPGEIIVREVELCAELGFPQTARYLIERSGTFSHFDEQQRTRLEAVSRQTGGEWK